MGTWERTAQGFTYWATANDGVTIPIYHTASEGPARRVFCKCLRCKRVETFDFTPWQEQYMPSGVMRSTPVITVSHRIALGENLIALRDFITVRVNGDLRCECGGRIEATELKATYNAGKPCNARCMGATGPACDCSCGGTQHGGKHLHVEA